MPFLENILPFSPEYTTPTRCAFDDIDETISMWRRRYSAVEEQSDFHRGVVWTSAQQSSFVEFMLRGGQGVNMILWGFVNESLLLVDGLQRLTAVRKFVAGEIPAWGYYYEDWEDRAFRINDYSLQFHVVSLRSKADALEWWLRLNGGGANHSREEEIKKVTALLQLERAKKEEK